MTTPRDSHTATLLLDGTVLIAGGNSNASRVATAEIYDPSIGTFSPTGTMSTIRSQHTATLLLDGRVLVAGGCVSCGSPGDLASAELYDPSSRTFSSTGSMAIGRSKHTATLLDSGMVLVAGGANGPGSLASAEIYNPATGSFSSAGSMITARYGHVAALLGNGNALVAGGFNSGSYLSSAELFTPPSPKTKTDCKGDGWRSFGFENQGHCVAFVNHSQGGGN